MVNKNNVMCLLTMTALLAGCGGGGGDNSIAGSTATTPASSTGTTPSSPTNTGISNPSPAAPTTPATPAAPTIPAVPANPTVPATPTAPATPAAPATPTAPADQTLRGYLSMVANQLVYINTDRSLYNGVSLTQFEGTTGMYDFASGSRTVNSTAAVPARVAAPAAPIAAFGLRIDRFVQRTTESQVVGNQSVVGRIAFNLVEREGTLGIRANEVAESMRFVIDGVEMGTAASGELTTVRVREGAQLHVQGRNAAGVVVQESVAVPSNAVRLLPVSEVLDNYGDNSSVVLLVDLEAAFSQAGTRLAALENLSGYFATQVTLSTVQIIRPVGVSDTGTAIPSKVLEGQAITVGTQAPVTGAGISGNVWLRMYPPQ